MPEETGIWLALSQRVFGIQVMYWLLIIGAIIFIIWKLKPKQEKFKRKDTKKELNKKFFQAYKDYGTNVGKLMNFGMFPKGYIFKANVLYWDRNLKFLIYKSKRDLKKFLKNNKDYADKDGKLKKDFVKINAFLVSGKSLFSRGLGKLGIGLKTYLIPDEYIIDRKDTIVVNPMVSPIDFFGFQAIGKEAIQIVENACFKLNRENELDEFVNQIPKQNYLEVSTATRIAVAREKAKIEKAKYKGQIEGAEEV